MATAPASMSIEQYLRTSFSPDVDFVRGEIQEDRISRAKVVLSDYLAMGVENVWLIDPIRRAVFTYDADGLHDAGEAPLRVAGTAISVDMQKIFEALD